VALRTERFNKGETILLSITVITCGMFLTFITGALSQPDGITNPFWGSVFGLGFWIEYTLFGSLPYGVLGLVWGVFGIILWPALAVFLFAKLVRQVQRAGSVLPAVLFYVIFAATLIFNVPVNRLEGSPIEHMPIFIRYLDFAPR
jgi:hypothetical protein